MTRTLSDQNFALGMQFSIRILLLITTLFAFLAAACRYFSFSFALMIVVLLSANLFVVYQVFFSRKLRSETDQGCWILVAIAFAICGFVLSVCLNCIGF